MFVISKGRVVILVFLFLYDYDGVIDIFNEIIRNFGWDLLVIVVEYKWIFDDFVEIIFKEGKGNKEDFEKVLVIGMFWEYVNSIVILLIGFDEKLNCMLLCLFGVFVCVEEWFIESLVDLSILSVK